MTNQQPPNPTVFTITIPQTDVQAAYQKELEKAAQQVTIKGFRPGKAPLKLAEEKLGKSSLYSQTIEAILPAKYQQEVSERKLTPWMAPRVKPISVKENEPWQFEVTVVQKPIVELGSYQEEIKKELSPTKIVTTVAKDQSKPDEELRQKQLTTVFDTLLKTTKVELPQLLIDEEVNLRLTQLLDQIRALGMTIDDYLRAKNLTSESLRQEYGKTARNALSLNLILDAVATDQNLTGKDRLREAVSWLTSL